MTERALEALRSFARARPPEVRERCDFCALALAGRHEHLLDPAKRDLRCACAGCALVLSSPLGSPWRRVPDRAARLALDLDDLDWASLAVPVDVAFLVASSAAGRTLALYPSPAGIVESSPPLDSWRALVAKNPALEKLEPDVEAVLVDRRRGARARYWVSIDRCYRLVALLRRSWRGFTGGPAVAKELDRFFAELEEETGA